MQFDITMLIAFFSLIISMIVCIVYIITAFRPKEPVATQEELDRFRCRMEEKCTDKHRAVAKQFEDLYNMDRSRTKEITNKIDQLKNALNGWQLGISRQLGNHDGRLENLEHK